MQGIVPEKHQRRIFDQLIQSGLDLVVKEGEVCSVDLIRCQCQCCCCYHTILLQCALLLSDKDSCVILLHCSR